MVHFNSSGGMGRTGRSGHDNDERVDYAAWNVLCDCSDCRMLDDVRRIFLGNLNLPKGLIMLNVTDLRKYGPTRVVTRVEDGGVVRADTPDQALLEYGIVPTGVLVRNDGWTLGYDDRTRSAALDLWAGDWVDDVSLDYGDDRDIAERIAYPE